MKLIKVQFFMLKQAWECTPGKELSWNVLSLFTTSGMLFLEVSLLAFLLQGNNASGLQALTRPFVLWAYCWSRFASQGISVVSIEMQFHHS